MQVAQTGSSDELDLMLGMDPDTGMVDVHVRHGEFIRPLQCDEVGLDNRSLAEMLSRNLLIDTPEGPAFIPADDWMSGAVEIGGIRDFRGYRPS